MSEIAEHGMRRLAIGLIERHPDRATRVIEAASPGEAAELLAGQSAAVVAGLLGRLLPDAGADVLAQLPDDATRRVLIVMYPQRAAALAARLEEADRERVLALLPQDRSNELRDLMTYPADSAGGLMDPRVLTLRPQLLVRNVRPRLRSFQRRRLHDIHLVDDEGRLCGSVALRDIVLADPRASLGSLVQRPPVSVGATSSRNEVVEILERERVASLPVVDHDGHVLGVLRQAQLVAAAQAAAAGDLVAMVGASRDERALSPPLFAVRKRLPWLQVNLLTAFLAASVVALFESTIAGNTALAVLLPVVAGQSGNTGAQALAVTMRGLALREVRLHQWMRVAGKEMLAGIGNGLAVAATTSLAVYVWSRSPSLAAVIGISMVISMSLASLSGAVIPMILTAARLDPAQSSSIILTTVTDVVGFMSFLGVATLLTGS